MKKNLITFENGEMIYANSFVHQDGEFPGRGVVVWYGLDENKLVEK